MIEFTRVWKLGVALCLLVTNACTSGQCPVTDLETRTIQVADASLLVEVATTPSERTCGLSLREQLDVNSGMLFVYAEDQILEFWMKDTWIPLTVAFLDSHGRIMALMDMDPANPTDRIRSGGPVRYALETRRGWFQDNNVKPGDIVNLDIDRRTFAASTTPSVEQVFERPQSRRRMRLPGRVL